jgi:hypothetical protein
MLDPRLIELLKEMLPSLKTQGQLSLFEASFNSLRCVLEGYFSGDLVVAQKGRDALEASLEAAKQMSVLTSQLREMPNEAKSPAAKSFETPAKVWNERDAAMKLLTEMAGITTLIAFQQWYSESRYQFENLVSQEVRNEVFDAIRRKRKALKEL